MMIARAVTSSSTITRQSPTGDRFPSRSLDWHDRVGDPWLITTPTPAARFAAKSSQAAPGPAALGRTRLIRPGEVPG
jgi:hypothetical protein